MSGETSMKHSFIAGAVAAALLASVPALAQEGGGGVGSALRANNSSIVGLGSTEWGGLGYGGPYAMPGPYVGYDYSVAPYYSGRSVVVAPAWGPRVYLPY